MTREETKRCIEVMQAYVDGKEIEIQNGLGAEWSPTNSPCWNFQHYSYRIKPEPEPTEVEKLKREVDELRGFLKEIIHVNHLRHQSP